MSEFTLEVQRRETKGKNSNRRLRAAGMVPAVIYGAGEPTPLQVPKRTMEQLLRDTADASPVFLLKLAGTDKTRHAMVRELQTNSVTGDMLHIDFQRVRMDEEVRTTVTIEIHGVPVGVKRDDGLLDFVTREVEISALPAAIPGHFDLNVEELLVGQHLEASDLELPDGVTLLTEPETVIVSIHGKRGGEEEEEEGVEEEVEGDEGEA